MKKTKNVLLGVVVILALASAPVLAGDMNLRLSSPAPVASFHHSWVVKFAKNLEDLSKGSIRTEVIGGGLLGGPKQTLAQLRAGKLDFWFIPVEAPFFAKEGKHFFVLFAPFLFRDRGHYRRFLASEVFEEMAADAEKKLNIKFVGILGDESPRSLSTVNRPVKSPDEMNGLKMRVPGLPFIAEIWKLWGASPTPMRGSEIYQALQTGMVEGDDNGIATIFTRGLDEVLKYHTPINYVYSGMGIYISGTTWSKLDDQQRAWAQKAASMVDQEQEPYDQMMNRFYNKAQAKGIEIVQPELEKFKPAVKEIVTKFEGKFWPEGLYQRIHEIP